MTAHILGSSGSFNIDQCYDDHMKLWCCLLRLLIKGVGFSPVGWELCTVIHCALFFPYFLNVIDFSIWPRRSFASNTYFSCFSDVFDVTLLLLLCVVQVQYEFNHVGFLQPLACVTADGDNGKANIDLFLWVFFVFEAFTHLTAQDSQNIFLIQSVDLVGWVLS